MMRWTSCAALSVMIMRGPTAVVGVSVAVAFVLQPMIHSSPGGSGGDSVRAGLGRLFLFLQLGLLLLVVLDGRLDGVLRQDRAVNLDRRQAQLLDDLGVAD